MLEFIREFPIAPLPLIHQIDSYIRIQYSFKRQFFEDYQCILYLQKIRLYIWGHVTYALEHWPSIHDRVVLAGGRVLEGADHNVARKRERHLHRSAHVGRDARELTTRAHFEEAKRGGVYDGRKLAEAKGAFFSFCVTTQISHVSTTTPSAKSN